MTESSQTELLSLLAEPDTSAGIPELVYESDSDDVSAVLLESIEAAQESSNRKFAPEEDAFVNSFFASESNSGDNWELMKAALLDALNAPDSHLDEEMRMARESGGDKLEVEAEEEEEEEVPSDNVYENWNVVEDPGNVWDLEDVSESFDVEIGLVKDLKKLLSNDIGTGTGTDTGTDTGAGAGTDVREWNSGLEGGTVNVDELVAELGKLFIESN